MNNGRCQQPHCKAEMIYHGLPGGANKNMEQKHGTTALRPQIGAPQATNTAAGDNPDYLNLGRFPCGFHHTNATIYT